MKISPHQGEGDIQYRSSTIPPRSRRYISDTYEFSICEISLRSEVRIVLAGSSSRTYISDAFSSLNPFCPLSNSGCSISTTLTFRDEVSAGWDGAYLMSNHQLCTPAQYRGELTRRSSPNPFHPSVVVTHVGSHTAPECFVKRFKLHQTPGQRSRDVGRG